MSVTQNLRSLADRWREQACRLRMLEAHGQAASLELAATELDAEIERLEQELLSISEASAVCGYSEEHLRRLVHEGSLPAEQRDQQERDWWRERVEKPLELKPTTGEVMTGVLKWVATFTILLALKGGDALILKHAIVLVSPGGDHG